MSQKQAPDHVVVDGSNIATEGRSMPSLAQLSEAVGSFMEEHPNTAITVVVDATFGHRIDKKEAKEFEEGIANNELVAPPAGAVGRGDAFVLGIANKSGASILSNDSFQEFHGDYEWLFDEGRLIGGKPVPHVGWVWVERVPVRGPVSRKATRGGGGGSDRGGRGRRGSGRGDNKVRTGSREASGPMPTPKTPPPGRVEQSKQASNAPSTRSVPKGGDAVNELMPFLDFVEHHPIGTSVNGTVDAYSSHGAYITISDSDVRGYIPLRLMADPAPRSAKKAMAIGESVTVVVVSFAAARRSIDCAMPDMADKAIAAARDTGDDVLEPRADDAAPATTAEKPARRKPAKKAASKKAATKRAVTKRAAAKKAAAKKTAAKKAPAKKSAAKKAPAKKSAAKKAPAKKTSTKRIAAKTSPTKKSPAKKPVATKAAAKKAPTRSSTAKRAAGGAVDA